MRSYRVLWDGDELLDGNVAHIAEHGLTIEDVEFVLRNPTAECVSKSTNKPCCFGYTPGGDFIIVIFEQPDEDVIYPITAYEVPEKMN